ncbi:MAG: hypothetical protein HFJ80_07280 [Clostridiales bacterium]|nr:hypothetical protein [Clostridiales bacterium]
MRYIRLVMAMLVLVTTGTLSGCARPATRRELIRWFQENYTDAPVVVAQRPVVEDNDETYEAYLEAHPELKFYIRSDYSYVMEHAVFHNRTNFYAVYGSYYFSEYQKEHPVQFAEYCFDEKNITFSLDVYYADRTELVRAFDELQDIQTYMATQEYPVESWHHIYFESPLLDRRRLTHTLGSGVVDLTGAKPFQEVIRRKQKDLECELAIWCSSFQLHTDWFTHTEFEQAFAYRESGEYDGSHSAYIGELAIYDGTERAAYYPRTVTPSNFALSFGQLYQILSDVGWETLEGRTERFSFRGADGVSYEFSYELQNAGRDYPICTWLADGEPYVGFGAGDGYITSDDTFHRITGLRMEMPPDRRP